MIGFLIFYYCFSGLFCLATVDETEYKTKSGAIAAAVIFFIFGCFFFPVILGITANKITKNY